MSLYSIAVLGKPTKEQRRVLERQIQTAVDRFLLDADDIEVVFTPESFTPS